MKSLKYALLIFLFHLGADAQVEVVYTWSTMMPLSVRGLLETESVCNKLQFTCKFVYDPFQPISWLEPELIRYAESQDLSAELIEAGILNHFPAYAVLIDGKLQGNVHLGYVTPDMLETIILRRLD